MWRAVSARDLGLAAAVARAEAPLLAPASGGASGCALAEKSTSANDFVSNAPKGVTVRIRASDGGLKSERCGLWNRVS